MIKYKIEIGGVDYTTYLGLPFKENYALDSALDSGVITLVMMPRKAVFMPFTSVKITKIQGTTNIEVNMLVANDKSTEIIGTGLYTHELTLIEETKLLEKIVVDTNTTTQPILHDYLSGAIEVQPVIIQSGLGVTSAEVGLMTPSNINEVLNLKSLDQAYIGLHLGNIEFLEGIISVSYNSVVVETHNITSSTLSTEYTYTPTNTGSYTIRYYAKYLYDGIGGTSVREFDKTYTIEVIEQPENANKKSISDVVNRLLTICNTLRASESPEFTFNAEQNKYYGNAKQTWLINDSPNVTSGLNVNIRFISNNENFTKISTSSANLYYSGISMYYSIGDSWRDNAYKTIEFLERPTGDLLTWLQANATMQSEELYYPAPEFSMTKSTLRECLDQVGGYIHSIVRLKGNEIYFDKLGGTEQATLNNDFIGHYENLDCEQYTSELDSVVNNLTNIDDASTGTITEPYSNGLKTVRAEGTIRIGDGTNDTSCIIPTEYPIEKIEKLEIGYIKVNNNDIYVGDITPYVYERSEYELLDSFGGQYPNSKGYAIVYSQGNQNITGLTFKLPNPVSPILSDQAIINIIEVKTGQSIQSAFKVQNFTELNYKITYYPSTTARVKQHRTDYLNYDKSYATIYNQGANKVDSRAYGENLKGAVARLGNIDKVITFTEKNINNLQKAGDYVIINNEDYYIANVSVENQLDYIKYTLALSKDFNALSKYIGIKNNIRMYEVSEKQSVERYVNYEDFVVIGTPVTSDNNDLLTSDAKECVAIAGTTAKGISLARVKGDNNTEMDLPVISLGIGNSLWFGFKYRDNYSAGTKSVTGATGDISDSDKFYRLNQDARYTDYFGEINSMSIKFYSEMADINDLQTALNIGNALPQATASEKIVDNQVVGLMGTTATDNIVIKKDNREQINFAYQVNFVTNDNIIIGNEFIQGNQLIRKEQQNITSVMLILLNTRINKFADTINLLDQVQTSTIDISELTFNPATNQVTIPARISNNNAKSWAVVKKGLPNETNLKLLFGKNIDIKIGDIVTMPTFTFTHKIRGLQ